ncbi:MAG: efflux RND transporter periplasmic adaptor subunit [Chitinispirillales bacterium]|jgi:membrane fusion protein (multidrug efflux system)|nr:efflux RND transporter periplasmic adaptor subunit [Chitinispirillales bacterium]
MMLVTAFGCSGDGDDSLDDVKRIVLPVKGVAAVKRDVVRSLNFSGDIDAHRRAAIAPAQAAAGSRVLRIYVEEGHEVREGQILARLEDFQLKQLEVRLTQLEADHNRMASLHSRGSVTQQQFEHARTAFTAAKAEYEQLKNSIELRAPFSGTIIGKYVNEGEVYRGVPGYDGTVGILSIAQFDRMKIDVLVSEQELVHLRYGQSAQITFDIFPNRLFEGKISTISPSISRVSRSASVTIDIVDEKRELRPGMFAKVEIAIETRNNVLAVPLSAVVVRGDREAFVFTVENNQAPFAAAPKQVLIRPGLITLRYVEILEGLEENTVVLFSNNALLTEETEVLVTDIF